MQVSSQDCDGKNWGRANETTPEEQAYKQAVAMIKHRLDRKYSRTPEEAQVEKLLMPMLAKTWKGDSLRGEWYMQPKLDGVRCLALWEGGDIILLSRSGLQYQVPHIVEALRPIMAPGDTFDGELYIHGTPFQNISSLARKNRTESRVLEYHIYDAPTILGDDGGLFAERHQYLRAKLQAALSGSLRCVYTTALDAASTFEILKNQSLFVKEGYEGAMLRDAKGVYRWGYRSGDLLKVKSFEDAEFRVTGFRAGVGKMANGVIFMCANDINKWQSFEVVPKGTQEERAETLQNGMSYVGKLLRVQFFGRSTDGIPRFPVGLGFPHPEEMGS
jgi:DNA ligase-1